MDVYLCQKNRIHSPLLLRTNIPFRLKQKGGGHAEGVESIPVQLISFLPKWLNVRFYGNIIHARTFLITLGKAIT